MTWVRIEDSMTVHSKVLPLSDGAFRAHVEAICHAARDLTDGYIAERVAKVMRWNRRATELVDAGLWDVVDGGWAIHDYLEYNPSREQVEADRAAKHDARVRAGRIGGTRSGAARRSKREANAKQTRSTDEANAQAKTKQNEAPSRPVPSRPEPTQITHIGVLRADELSVEDQAISDSLHEQVHRLVFGGSSYVDVGWCEDLIRRGATQTDVDFAIQQGIPKHSAQYVRAVLESRVKEREQGRDPDAVRQSRARPSNAMQPTPAQRDRFRAIVVTGVDDDGNPIREVAT